MRPNLKGESGKLKAVRWVALILVIVFIIPFSGAFGNGLQTASTESSNDDSLIAYRAEIIPKIHGKISPKEWSDAKPYIFRWDSDEKIAKNQKLMVTLTTKHDERKLYLLFTINDDDVEDRDALDIEIKLLREQNSSDANTAVLLATGEGYEGYPVRCGPGTYGFVREIDGRAEVRYQNGFYVFEASLNLTRYFNISGSYAKAIFQYTDEFPENSLQNEVVTIGNYEKLFLSQKFYSGSENVYDIIQSLYIHQENSYYILIGVIGIFICGTAFIVIYRRKKEK